MTHELAGDRSLEDFEREALENLAKQPYELTQVKPGHVMLGAEYGAEMVLLPKVLTEVQAKVGAKLIAVGLAKARHRRDSRRSHPFHSSSKQLASGSSLSCQLLSWGRSGSWKVSPLSLSGRKV